MTVRYRSSGAFLITAVVVVSLQVAAMVGYYPVR